MPVPRLLDIAKRVAIHNIKGITDIGDLPYELVRPVLLKLQNPKQLEDLELNCPQLRGANIEIWQMFITRDIPLKLSEGVVPKNPHSWGRLYNKLMRELKKQEDEDTLILKAQLDQLAAQKASNTSTFIKDPKQLPKLPMEKGIRREAKELAAAEKRRPGTLALGTGSRARLVGGRAIMDIAKREASQASLFKNTQSPLSMPTHLLSGRASAVTHVPQGLVEDHKRNAPSYTRPQQALRSIVPPRKTLTSGPTNHLKEQTLQDREKRLLALKLGKTTETQPMTQSSTSGLIAKRKRDDEVIAPSPTKIAKRLPTSAVSSSIKVTPSSSVKPIPKTLSTVGRDPLFDEPEADPSPGPPRGDPLVNDDIPKTPPAIHLPTSSSESTPDGHTTPHRVSRVESVSISPPNSKASTPGVIMKKKKKPVDIFMRNVKRVR